MNNTTHPGPSEVFSHIIDNKAPERLRGLEIKAVLTMKRLVFVIDMPDDATAQEVGYFNWLVGETTDKIMDRLGPDNARLFNKSVGTELTEEEKHALEGRI